MAKAKAKKVKVKAKEEGKGAAPGGFLPSEPTEPVMEMESIRWLLHGPPKVGKTTLASLFNNPLFLKCEEGTRGLRAFGVDIFSWQDMRDAVTALREEEHSFKVVVIDVIETALRFLREDVAEEANVSHISQLKWGRGWDLANQRMYNFLEEIWRNLNLGVILISHSKQVESSQGGIEVQKYVPSLSSSARERLIGWVDVTVFLGIEEVLKEEEDDEEKPEARLFKRVLICQPMPDVEAGGRFRFLPEKIDMGTSPIEGYQNLKKEFGIAKVKFMAEIERMKREGG